MTAESPLRSTFADDTDMMELVEYFISELPERIDGLESAFRDDDRATLKRLAHQLKGAAGGYGYPSITECAANLERAVLADHADVKQISARLDDVLDLCRRALSGADH